MSSAMHVYGGLAQPGMLDRWPAPTVPASRTATRAPIAWPMPNIASRVELPPPPVWGAPDPDLLMSITIAPLRFVPISWGPPVVVRSAWGPPADETTTVEPSESSTGRVRRRAWAFGLAAATAVGVVATVAAIR